MSACHLKEGLSHISKKHLASGFKKHIDTYFQDDSNLYAHIQFLFHGCFNTWWPHGVSYERNAWDQSCPSSSWTYLLRKYFLNHGMKTVMCEPQAASKRLEGCAFWDPWFRTCMFSVLSIKKKQQMLESLNISTCSFSTKVVLSFCHPTYWLHCALNHSVKIFNGCCCQLQDLN